MIHPLRWPLPAHQLELVDVDGRTMLCLVPHHHFHQAWRATTARILNEPSLYEVPFREFSVPSDPVLDTSSEGGDDAPPYTPVGENTIPIEILAILTFVEQVQLAINEHPNQPIKRLTAQWPTSR